MSEETRLHCASCDRTLTAEDGTFVCAAACSLCVSCIGQTTDSCPECGGKLEHLRPQESRNGAADTRSGA